MDGWTDGWMYGRMNGWMIGDRWMDGWMDEWLIKIYKKSDNRKVIGLQIASLQTRVNTNNNNIKNFLFGSKSASPIFHYYYYYYYYYYYFIIIIESTSANHPLHLDEQIKRNVLPLVDNVVTFLPVN